MSTTSSSRGPHAAGINLNTATVDQLRAVRGIGRTRALKIARFRERQRAPIKARMQV